MRPATALLGRDGLHFMRGGRPDVRSQQLALSLEIGTPWLYNGIITTTPRPCTDGTNAACTHSPAAG